MEQALSLVVASARSEMVASLRGARRYAASSGGVNEDVECALLMVHGSLRHVALRLLQRGGLCVLSKAWRWAAERVVEAAHAMFHELTDKELQAEAEMFPHTTSSFGAALAAGVEWDTAILGHVQQRVGTTREGTGSASVARTDNLWEARGLGPVNRSKSRHGKEDQVLFDFGKETSC